METVQQIAVDTDELIINTIRTLSMDGVQMANSGHPGTPMALAPVAFTIWDKYMRFDPHNPDFPNRDRFILIWIYDNNRITIEGETSLAFSEDVATRFLSYNWHVQRVGDANDTEFLERALQNAVNEKERPSLLIVDSHIAFGSPNKQDTAGAHGAPLGEEEIRATKEAYGWDPDRQFYVPPEVEEYREAVREKGERIEVEWNEKYKNYRSEYPDLAKEFELIQKHQMPDGWDRCIPEFPADEKGVATRKSNGQVLNAIAKHHPWLLGGAADLAPSTNTLIDGADGFGKGNYKGRNFHFGIREHAMGAVANGMALSKLRPYAATFLIFSDYMRPAIRLSALMEQPVIYIFTHDSIGLGDDGPTHQPVEHIASLRAIPNLDVIRPADANEVAVLWKYIMELQNRPAALILSRQNVPTIDRSKYASADGALRGAYVLADSESTPEVILIGTGSEVQLKINDHK